MELNISNIQRSVSKEIFDKGLELYLKNKVDKEQLKHVDIGSEIKYTYPITSLDTTYFVSGKIKKEDKDYFITGSMCKCFYCHNNKAICEHIIAFYLVLMDNFNYGNEDLHLYATDFYKKEKEDKLISLFNSNNLRNVRLRPFFIISKKQITLKLFINSEKEYTISNINLFIEAVKNESVLKYGKKLEFKHSLNSFDNKSRKLIELLLISNLEYVNKSLLINEYLLEQIIYIYKNDVVTFNINEVTYKINNKLIDNNLSINIDTKEMFLELPYHLYLLKCYDKLILIDNNDTYSIMLNNNEINLVNTLLDNKLRFNIVGSEEFIFSNVFPKVKRIVQLSDELEEKFPSYDLTINSYFDFSNSLIELKTEIIENNKVVNKEELEVLSKVKYYQYEELLNEYYFDLSSYTINNTTSVIDFLHADISKFKEYGEVYLSEKIKKANIKKTGKFSLGINYNLNLLELSIDSKLSNEDLQTILSAYRSKEKYVVLKSNVIFELDDDVKELARIVEEYSLDEENLKTPKLKPSYTILNLLKEDNVDKKETIEVLNEFTNFKDKDIYPIESINSILRPYQLEAFRWLSTIAKYGFGGLLADDMGLGKTLEILSLVLSDEIQKPSIIISPMSLVYNWHNEITKWGNDVAVKVIIGNAKEREELVKSINYNKKTIYLVSYDMLKKDIEHFLGEFRYVILDEAQYIKNKNTKTAISVKRLDSQVRFALTGTPIENSLSDLWSIFDFILPNYLSSYNKFKNDYEVVDYTSESLDLIQRKVSPFILRRTKKDVLKELPDKIEEIYYTNLSEKQEHLYNAYLNKARNSLSKNNEIEILSILTRLRQICVSPKMFLENYDDEEVKIDLTLDLITKAINGGHKILLFSQFTSSFEVLSKRLLEKNIKYYTITGKTGAKDRVTLANDFNTKEEVSLFLISLKAGGTGLNLYGADTVIHLDPWWNISAESQATDRAHRIGQKKVLNVIKIICANTIEEKVLKLQSYKAELSSKVIDSENKSKKLNIKDLEFLLS